MAGLYHELSPYITVCSDNAKKQEMATQKKTTRKLSGPSKDHFFDRFFGDDKGLDEESAQRLSQRSKAVFTSVRVRKLAGRRGTSRARA
jgi:hypothetical protein